MDRFIKTGIPPPDESDMQNKLSGVAVGGAKSKGEDASDEEDKK